MEQETLARYRDYRARGHSANSAYRCAKHTTPPHKFDISGVDTLRIKRGNADILIEVEPDISFCTSDDLGYGTFTDKWSPGAVKCHATSHSEWKYYEPTMTVEMHKRGLTKLGMPRHVADTEARRYVREDHERAAQLMRGGSNLVSVTVTVYVRGIRIGHDSIGLVELSGDLDMDQGYLNEVIKDTLTDVMADAQEALLDLQGLTLE